MSLTTTDELLIQIRGRIERLGAGSPDGLTQVRRRVAALRRDEASTLAAVQDVAASVEHSVRDLDARVEIAERSTAADLAEDLGAFLDAVIGELRAWDVYLERRQLRAALTLGADRPRAEAAIRDLRRAVDAVRQCVVEVRAAAGEAQDDGRKRVQGARDVLERCAAESQPGLSFGERCCACRHVD
jgi:hypothetical protein